MKSKNVLLVLMTMLLFQCASEKPAADQPKTAAAENSVRNISVEDAKSLMEKNPEAIILDVRTPEEYDGVLGHISGSILKPVQEIDTWAPEFANRKNAEIVIFCRSGGRSGRAAKYLNDLGFRNIINVEGGMTAWNEKGFPVEKGDN